MRGLDGCVPARDRRAMVGMKVDIWESTAAMIDVIVSDIARGLGVDVAELFRP